jgi:RHH-type rel operon transcriptional repressor/antitoxin RelB
MGGIGEGRGKGKGGAIGLVFFLALVYMYSKWSLRMLALRLPPDIEARLELLARKTGRTKSYYAREAILAHLDDLEDAYLATSRLKSVRARVSLEDLEAELDG